MAARSLATLLLLALAASEAAPGIDARFRLASREEMAAGVEGDGGGEGPAAPTSRKRAFLLSLLLPGLGQGANGSELRMKAFLGAEAVIWTSFVVFKVQEANRTEDFEEYARAFASVPGGEKETEFHRILTIFDNVDQYNEAVRAEARSLYPVSDYPQATRDRYFDEHGYGPDRSFRWRTRQARLDYRLIRNDALDSGRRADYMLVAAIVNRAVSAVEAARSGGRIGSLAEGVGHVRAEASGPGEPPLLRLGVAVRF
jgi:hypothetical protein